MINYKICSQTAMGEYEYFLGKFFTIAEKCNCDTAIVIQASPDDSVKDLWLTITHSIEIAKELNSFLFVYVDSKDPVDGKATEMVKEVIKDGWNRTKKCFNYTGRVLSPGQAPFLLIADTDNLHRDKNLCNLVLNTSNQIYSDIEREVNLEEGAIPNKSFRKLIDAEPGICSSIKNGSGISEEAKKKIIQLYKDAAITALNSF